MLSLLILLLVVLHPRHKLEYFQTADWEPECINRVHQLIHDTFRLTYATHDIPQMDASTSDQSEDESQVSTTHIPLHYFPDHLTLYDLTACLCSRSAHFFVLVAGVIWNG